MSTDVIYIAEDIGDIVSEASATANMDDQQTPPHITDNLPKRSPSSSKSTEVQSSPPATNKKFEKEPKWLHLPDINKFIAICPVPITLVRVETDVEGSANDLVGPWLYRNANCTWIHYTATEHGKEKQEQVLLQNLFRRGFAKKRSSNVTPKKRKNTDCPLESPMKRFDLEDHDSTPVEEAFTERQESPLKRKLFQSDIESPLKRLNIDDGDITSTSDTFKKPVTPDNAKTGSKYGRKPLTLQDINKHILKSNTTICSLFLSF